MKIIDGLSAVAVGYARKTVTWMRLDGMSVNKASSGYRALAKMMRDTRLSAHIILTLIITSSYPLFVITLEEVSATKMALLIGFGWGIVTGLILFTQLGIYAANIAYIECEAESLESRTQENKIMKKVRETREEVTKET